MTTTSTVKSGFQKANNLAFCRLNALNSAKGIKAPKRLGFLLYGTLRNIAQPDVARGHSHATTMDGTLLDRFSGPQSGESYAPNRPNFFAANVIPYRPSIIF
ncbi:MAG: hypothetical protein J0M22_15645 [Gammaproteobacteria bacterium]|nr:hypothetical protein [Gammaproteobacteria bacterium]